MSENLDNLSLDELKERHQILELKKKIKLLEGENGWQTADKKPQFRSLKQIQKEIEAEKTRAKLNDSHK